MEQNVRVDCSTVWPRWRHESGNVVTVLVDSGATGHYFDETIIPDLKHRFQDYTSLSTPRTILTAGGALLDGTAEGVLQVFITDDYGEWHLARMAILTVPGIGRNLFSQKTAARKGIVSIFDVNKPKMEAGDITVPLGWRERRSLLLQARMDTQERSWS